MPIIPLTCPNCGGDLLVDSSNDAYICDHCGRPFIVKDAIVNNYIRNETIINTDTFTAENVNVYSEKDFEIIAGKLISYNGESDHIVIPETVKIIGYRAFAKMPISSVSIPETVLEIESEAFCDCNHLKSVSISSNTMTLGVAVFCSCQSLTSIVFPGRIESIPDKCFKGCISLTQPILPDSITSIGKSAFEGCASISQLVIPNNVVSIGDSAFSGCTSLAQINIPDGVTEISNSMFNSCSSLSRIHIPNSITRIGSNAFRNCSSLNHITIPLKTQVIGSGAFMGCSSLNDIIFENLNNLNIYFDAFFQCVALDYGTARAITRRINWHDPLPWHRRRLKAKDLLSESYPDIDID